MGSTNETNEAHNILASFFKGSDDARCFNPHSFNPQKQVKLV